MPIQTRLLPRFANGNIPYHFTFYALQPQPQPQEPPEDPTESDQQSEEEPQLLKYSIVVERDGDEVTVRLEQGKSTVAERSAKAKMSDYQGAMKFVSDKLGTDILKLK